LIALAGCIQRFNHQPAMAGRKAQQFADVAFVKRDLDAAYPLLSQNTRASITIDQFKDLVSKMHPSDYPLFVRATDYEPLMGQKAMNIYLIGEAESGRLYYRFVMEGTQESDYMVGGVWRNDAPYPASNLRKPL
jgi:hypothetical protein